MNLQEIKGLFIEVTGRTDLADQFVCFLINEGQKYLDRRVSLPSEAARWYKALAQSDQRVIFSTQVRAIKAIYLIDAALTDGRKLLIKKSVAQLKTSYPDPTTEGEPEYWAPLYSALIGGSKPPNLMPGIPVNWVKTMIDTPSDMLGIELGPACEQAYQLEMYCTAYTPELVNPTDVSVWTTNFPMQLLNASVAYLDLLLKNVESYRSSMAALSSDLHDMISDQIENEVAGLPSAMEG